MYFLLRIDLMLFKYNLIIFYKYYILEEVFFIGIPHDSPR